MVMHARKLPRLNDGYFDRNQTHSYLNSNKYSSSKASYGERYADKVRDSPSNGGNYRSDSPDNQHSPRDRSYHNKSSYSQRLKERERDRHDRDTSRSPKDKSSKSGNSSRDYHQSSSTFASHRASQEGSEHRSNHDRNNVDDVKEREKRIQVGDWSEHMSSSGKRYYYNCKTEVSQWEKPKDWLEWERQGKGSSDGNKIKERNYEKTTASSSSTSSSSSRTSDKHSSERNSLRQSTSVPNAASSSSSSSSSSSAHYQHHSRSHDGRHHTSKSGSCSGLSSRNFVTNEQTQQHRAGSSHSLSRNENHARDQRETSDETTSRRETNERRNESRKNTEESQMQDMDISPDSTPTGANSQPNSQPQSQTQTPQSAQSTQPSTTQASMSLANLPKLLSQLAGNKGLPNLDKTELSPQEALQTLQTALLLTRQVSLAQTNMTNQSPHSTVTHNDTSPFLSQKSPLPVPMPSHCAVPGTSTSSSETRIRNDEDRGRVSPGGSEYSHRSSRRGSPTSSISSLHSITPAGPTSLVSAALRPAAPMISPSLANYVREDLITHITGWQADHAERQAHRYSEEAHSIGSLNSTRVSAELKMARSLVRVAEIQATLQEQRILFLRQQIKELEDWKSQNSFMSDS